MALEDGPTEQEVVIVPGPPGRVGRMGEDKYRERFVRWQSITITQLGYAVNLILGLSTAALGFSLTLLKDPSFAPQGLQKLFFDLSVSLLLASTGVGLWCVCNRLKDFRTTMRNTRVGDKLKRAHEPEAEIGRRLNKPRTEARKLGKCTWLLFKLQVWLFAFGVVMLSIAFAWIYSNKVWWAPA